MAEEMPRADEVQNLTPEQVAAGLTEGRMLLVDVREPNETSVESYPDAVIVPLSAFDPAAIPDPQGRQVVFACRSGRRSVTASLAAQDQGYPYRSHHAGGIIAWKAAGRQRRCCQSHCSGCSRIQPSTTLVMICMVPATSILPCASRAGAICSVISPRNV